MLTTIEAMTALTVKLDMLCKRARLRPADLAREVGGISKSTMSNWMNGLSKPDLDTALKMARVFGVPLDYLADDSQDEPPISDLTDDERTVLTVVRAAGLDAQSAVAALWAARDGRPATTEATPARQPGYWRGGEAQTMTDSLLNRERERKAPKKVEPQPDVEIAPPLKDSRKPGPPERKRGAG